MQVDRGFGWRPTDRALGVGCRFSEAPSEVGNEIPSSSAQIGHLGARKEMKRRNDTRRLLPNIAGVLDALRGGGSPV